jgi:hypothetical protein
MSGLVAVVRSLFDGILADATMNSRQRDLFLWQWHRRRSRGLHRVSLLGGLVGAAGGLLFAVVMTASITRANGSVAATLAALQQGIAVAGMAIPSFAGLGFWLARHVFSANEAMYRALLDAGHRVPDRRVELTLADRGPALAVALAMVVILGFIGTLMLMYG